MFWGTGDAGKPRTRILQRGLALAGADVEDCSEQVWAGIEDKSAVRSAFARARLGLKWLASYPRLVARFLRAPRPDVVLVGYPGVLDVLVLGPFARLRRVPIAWDMFMSLYDTVAIDRALVQPEGLVGRLLAALERRALARADCVFLDTAAHARYVERLHSLPAGTCGHVWVGAEPEQFATAPPRARSAALRVLFYGQFIPLHGIETIVAAARLAADAPIEWTLIGQGQEAPRIRALLDAEPLPKVRWLEWVDYARLQQCIADADVCLGIFGTSEKAAAVIPNKVFQVVAVGRPLVTRDSPAIRELFAHESSCVRLVAAADPAALLAALDDLARTSPPATCHADARARSTPEAIGAACRELLRTRCALA